MSDPIPGTPEHHIATMEAWEKGTDRDPGHILNGPIAWALPILRVSLATSADRDRVAGILNMCAGPSGSNVEQAMIQGAAMIRTLTNPNPLMPADIRHALETHLGTSPNLTPMARNALTWILREKRGSASTDFQPSPNSDSASPLMVEIPADGTRVISEWSNAIRAVSLATMPIGNWLCNLPEKEKGGPLSIDQIRAFNVATYRLAELAGKTNPMQTGPAPTDMCPCCERVIQDIRGEAPIAHKEWVCSDCIDSGMIRRMSDRFTLSEDENSRDVLAKMAMDLEMWAYPIGWAPEIRRFMARAIRRFLSAFDALESAPCPSPGCPSNAKQDTTQHRETIDPRSVLRVAAEREASPTLKAAMMWAASDPLIHRTIYFSTEDEQALRAILRASTPETTIEAAERMIRERNEAWRRADSLEAIQAYMMPDPQIQRIRKAIEMLADWQEAAGTEAANGPTPAAKERASGQAMLLLQVVGLLGLAMGPADLER